jgi:hypothetical protein
MSEQKGENLPRLKSYTEEEIDAFLDGDRRVIDRLLLHGLNNLAVVLIAHAAREEEIFTGMGSAETIKKRSDWIDSQIEKTRVRNDMMGKVATSTTAWALVAFFGFIAMAIWEYVITLIKSKTGVR